MDRSVSTLQFFIIVDQEKFRVILPCIRQNTNSLRLTHGSLKLSHAEVKYGKASEKYLRTNQSSAM
jgi:hypothetical protein